MSADARILVASDVVADAESVRKLLSEEFPDVLLSTDPEQAVSDFERSKPDVIFLAFNTLEKAERYYLGLYRLSPMIHGLPHRTLILCNQNAVHRAYDLCRRDYFDDYILFWPLAQDPHRLAMAVRLALRGLESARASAPVVAMAAQARRIVELEALLVRQFSDGGSGMATASQSLQRAEAEIGAAIQGLSKKLIDGDLGDAVEVHNAARLHEEFSRLKRDGLERSLRTVNEAVQPMRQWLHTLQDEVAPVLQSARALKVLVDRIRPVVLVVDDDPIQHKLLAHLLEGQAMELRFAASGTEALRVLCKCRPDLILMDVMLPDINGVEVTRRLKAVEPFAAIPVIMITGQGEKAVVIESLKAGAADFVVKPLDREVLLKKVTRFLAA